ANDFQGLDGQKVPVMTDEYILTVSERYIELYENIMGESFVKADVSDIQGRIAKNIENFLFNRN
ncbi:MAG: phosphoribosylaminoimidazolesuccinocarboxamide synthase, partial [Aquaticitalea sp.]